jgi:imidazolonepropionase-like amidohydrolase
MSAPDTITIFTSLLFNPKTKQISYNASIKVDRVSGSIVGINVRSDADEARADLVGVNDIDLRYRFVMPGFVDSHSHIFLHSYKLSVDRYVFW